MNPTESRPAALSRWLPLVPLLLLANGCSSGNGNGGSNLSAPADTTAPTVSVNAVTAALSRTATLGATASDNVGVTQVEFRVDGTAIGTDTSALYSVSWDTSAAADGTHSVTAVASDAAGNATTSAAVEVTVRNLQRFEVTLAGEQENPPSASAVTGTGTIEVNLLTGAASGAITLSGLTATAAHIHDGFAGVNGPIVVGFEQDGADPARWQLPAGTTLTSGQLDRLLSGALYVNAHSEQFPAGEVRAQLLPENVRVFFTNLSAREEPGFIEAQDRARGALTVDTGSRAITAHLRVDGIDNVADAHLHQAFAGANGPVSVGLAADPADAAHWFVENATLSQAAFDALLTGGLYFNVHTPENPDGHVRGQVVPPGVTVVIADLEGLQEVPAVTSDARARAAVTLDEATRAIRIHLNSQGLDDATAAHLHRSVAGTNGGIAVGLTQDGSASGHWFVENATLEPADVEAFRAAGTYVNIHTPANPGGELRGQVVPPGMLVVVNPMGGEQEVPPQTTTAAGTAALTVNTTTGATEVHVNARGADDAAAAHVHDAFAGVNGPVLIGLSKDADPASPGHWLAAGATMTAEQIARLRAGGLYANVHTPAAPGGLIRGQLLTPEVRLTLTDLTGSEEVPPVTTTASARAATTVNTSALTVTIHVNTSQLDTANAAHLHRGAAGSNGPVTVGLTRDAGTPSRWSAIDAPITAEQLQDYLGNQWYLNVHTPAHPDGEVRGQVIGSPEPAAPTDTQAPAVTLGAVPATISGTITLTATATDDIGVTAVRFKVNGAVVGSDTTSPYELAWNSATVANGAVTLSAEAEDAAGNVGSSAEASATVANATGATPFTFGEIQAQVFNVSCAVSGCHAGPSPQAGMNLSAGVSYGNIVNVASTEVPSLLRVAPNDAANSYLIRKLEGGPDIRGERMPLGGPFLSQATIDRIRAWIDAGAPADTGPALPPSPY